MEVVITDSPDTAADVVAGAFAHLVRHAPAPVLGLATGSSPLGVYARLVAMHRAGTLSFAHARAFLLDEYVGLPVDHPEAYRTFIHRHFTGLVDFSDGAVQGPDGTAADVPGACAAYEHAIAAAGGIDLQLLGIGTDGHVGFNEPSSSLASRTRVKTLTDRTRRDNARFFDSLDEVPHHVVTQGIGTILDARHLVLIATGEAKAAPIAAAVEGPLTAFVPASAIQLHPHVTVVVDEAAASGLRLREYYRDTFAAKPSWQGL